MQVRLIFKLLASLLISHFIIMIGANDWLSVFTDWLYYKDLVITFVSVFIVFEYVDRITQYLDRKFVWKTNLVRRTSFQIVLAVIVPCLMAVLLTFLQYEFIYDQDLIETGYFRFEFPATILLVVIVNLVFVISYLLRTSHDSGVSVDIHQGDTGPTVIMGKKGNKSVPVPRDEIAYIKLRNGLPFLTSHSNEATILSENLDHYEKILPPADFFRANRQTIISRSSCKSFKAVENGKIEILLKADVPESVIVSQKKASKFRSWVRR